MNWLSKLFACLPLIPGVVQGVESIAAAGKSGADKKALALQALGLAGGVAATVDAGDAVAITSVTEAVGNMIDLTVGLFNKHGWPGAQPATKTAPAPVAK